MRDILRDAASDGFWVMLGQLASALAALVSVRVLTELMTPAEYGGLMLELGLVALFVGAVYSPRLQGLMRYYEDFVGLGYTHDLRKENESYIATLVLPLCLVAAAAWAVASIFLPLQWWTGILLAAFCLVDSKRLMELAFFSAARRQRPASIVYAADAWARPLGAVLFIGLFGSHPGVALCGLLVGAAVVVLAAQFALPMIGLGPTTGDTEATDSPSHLFHRMRRYVAPLLPLALFGWLAAAGDRYVIAGRLSLADAGLYVAAAGLASRPFIMFSTTVELTMRPILQSAISVGDDKRIRESALAWIVIAGVGGATGVVAFDLLAVFAGRLFLAEEFHGAIELMPWIALGQGLSVVAVVFTRFCYAFDRTGFVLMITIFGSVIGLAAMYLALGWNGLRGVAIAVPVSFLCQALLAGALAFVAYRTFGTHRRAIPK